MIHDAGCNCYDPSIWVTRWSVTSTRNHFGGVCVFVAGWCWAWGPCQWLLPSEFFPLETRSVGLNMEVSVNYLFSFVIIESFLTMFCSLKWGPLSLLCCMELFRPIFCAPLCAWDQRSAYWGDGAGRRRHWFWKRFMPVDNYIDNSLEKPWNKTASNIHMYVTFKHHLTCFWVANGVQFEFRKIQTKSYDYHKVVKARWFAYLCLDSLVQHV